MADRDILAQHHPAVRDFRLAEVTGFRGDVPCYVANVDTPSFSTDAQGFRYTVFEGRKYSVVECTRAPRYGLVLGPSSLFGAGIPGDENTLASRLSARFGFPFGNASMPGGNSRNLNSLLVGLMAGARQPPAVVVLSNGGDLANFCNAGFVDPVFGSPNHMMIKKAREMREPIDSDAEFQKLLVFTALWTSATAKLCQARKIPLAMVHQSTFFEKTKPSAAELECKLGEAGGPGQLKIFANFRKYNPSFFTHRQDIAKRFGIPLAGVGLTDRLNFIDEFHIDAAGIALISEKVSELIEPLITASSPP